jgi:DNA polymerase III alpha subunit
MKTLETQLKDRTLRFDGVSIVSPNLLADLLTRGIHPSLLRVSSTSSEVEAFNLQVADSEKINESKLEPLKFNLEWRLPEYYKVLPLNEYVIDIFSSRINHLDYSNQMKELAFSRIADELEEIQIRGMTEFFKSIIYVLDSFKEKNIVWGVGRGSSCASYILFILGLHVVDCVKYDVPMDEFFHY